MKQAASLSDVARLGAERFGPRPALARSASAGGGGLTYDAMWESVSAGARALRAAGLADGDRVVLAAPPQPAWTPALLAILEAGLVAVPLPPAVDGAEARAAVAFVDAHAVIADGPGSFGRTPVVPLALLFASDAPSADVRRPTRDDLALLVFTSGSTAHPRVVELTHGNLLADLEGLLALRTAAPGDAFLSMLPPSHLFELVGGTLGPLACGARIVYAGAPLPNRIVTALRQEKITHALAVPALLEALFREVREALRESGVVDEAPHGAGPAHSAQVLRDATPHRRDIVRAAVREVVGPSLRTLVVGGAASSPAWSEVLAAVGVRLEVGYGLTEASPIVTMGAAHECPPGSVGRPLPGVVVEIGEGREILVGGPTTSRGYFRDPEATRAALADGRLRTGDVGRIDENGFLFVEGRVKEAMVSASGETVWPDEMEAHYASPLFAEWVVVPVRGEDGNDVATLVARPRDPRLSDDEFDREAVRLRAAAPPRLRYARVRRTSEPLPRTATGKVRRRALGESLSPRGPAA